MLFNVIKSSGISAENVADMREMKNVYEIMVGKSEGKRPLPVLGVDWKIMKYI
jgi:hypothetical protein